MSRRRSRHLWRAPWFPTAAAAALGVVHALAVAPTYHVGSFDDDGSYLLIARALAHGTGLGGVLSNGHSLLGAYPPGYPLLLAPIVLLTHAIWPMRALSLACFVAVFFLSDAWLRRCEASRATRVAVLVLLALNPMAATYATMVMAEMPFLVGFLGLLLVLARWDREHRTVGVTAAAAVLAGVAVVWLKEAGVGLVAGAALWQLLRRRPARAAVFGVGAAVLVAPLVLLRWHGGIAAAGTRYTVEIGRSFHGWPAPLEAVGRGVVDYVGIAFPRAVLPVVSVPAIFWVAYALVPLLAVTGAVVWARRHDAVSVVVVGGYVAETLFFPYVNERRVVLVLPVVLAWCVVGAQWAYRRAAAAAPLLPRLFIASTAASTAGSLVLVPLVLQFPRDYRFPTFVQSSHPIGSPYAAALSALAGPATVVETPYIWTTGLVVDARTANGLYAHGCDADMMRRAALADGGDYVLLAALNRPPPIVSCHQVALDSAPWAVLLSRCAYDDASIYELVGPGTTHPDLRAVPLGPAVSSVGAGTTAQTWWLPRPAAVSQVTVGDVDAADGSISDIRLQWRDRAGRWHVLASSLTAVDPKSPVPLLVGRPGADVTVTALRVTAYGMGPLLVDDVTVLADRVRR